MNKIILLNKPITLTPLQAIRKLQTLNPKLKGEKIGYAGRLDPMAEGLLLLLIGEANKKRKEYERLDKEYEFEVVLGLTSDSYDILGIIEQTDTKLFTTPGVVNTTTKYIDDDDNNITIQQLLQQFVGTSDQPYPPYSAARVNGKPLYYWAREGKIDEITIPSKEITVHSIQLNGTKELKLSTLQDEIITRIQSVKGTFRQEEIIARWNKTIQQYNNLTVKRLSCTISCSSGTYVRSVAHQIGQKLGVGGIALSIKRTKIGVYVLKDALDL